MSSLVTLDADTNRDEILLVLAQDGAVVIVGIFSGGTTDQLRAELQPYVEATSLGKDYVSGTSTTRTGALVARSPTHCVMVLNKTLMHAAEEFLEPFCSRNQLSVGQAIQLLPGETNQPIHRDRWAWMGVQGVETQFNSMLAVTDFTAENGATVVAPGSQTWPNKRRPEECQITQGVMRKGSVLASTGPFFTGRNKSLGRA